MKRERLLRALCVALVFCVATPGGAQSNRISQDEMKQWLTYISSDQLQGRQVFTEGLALAGAYIADHLKEWGVKPAGDEGGYFQTVKVLGVRTRGTSSVTVTVNGQTRTFKDGQGVTFPRNQGAKQTVTARLEFVGYGLTYSPLKYDDYAARDVKGAVALYLGRRGPGFSEKEDRIVGARARFATETMHAAGAIGPAAGAGGGGRGNANAGPQQGGANSPGANNAGSNNTPASTAGTNAAGNGAGSSGTEGSAASGNPTPANAAANSGASTTPAPGTPAATGPAPAPAANAGNNSQRVDFTTVQRLDRPVPPAVTVSDDFYQFVFSAAGQDYADLKAKAGKSEALPKIDLKNASVTFTVDADYDIIQTRLTRNVVGIIEGSDARLRDSYVFLGAHYDHVGYQQFAGTNAAGVAAIASCAGQTRREARPGDIINNGADDDGSGTVSLMALAKAFATGQKPKRSLLFVWHSGEEAGLYGSRYMADYPVVPLDKVAAQLNIDMVGRNECDSPDKANTVFLVGSDRISSELHNLNEDANASQPMPMTLDYTMNDIADPESLYTRSDHYSYASKGIPIIFFTTGLHRDYHYVTDEVDKILFPKMQRVAQLVYTTASRVANLDHLPVRDNLGPRVGKGNTGKVK